MSAFQNTITTTVQQGHQRPGNQCNLFHRLYLHLLIYPSDHYKSGPLITIINLKKRHLYDLRNNRLRFFSTDSKSGLLILAAPIKQYSNKTCNAHNIS